MFVKSLRVRFTPGGRTGTCGLCISYDPVWRCLAACICASISRGVGLALRNEIELKSVHIQSCVEVLAPESHGKQSRF